MKIARIVVSLEFGSLALLVGFPAFIFLASVVPALLFVGFLIYMLLSGGVAILNKLNSVRDQASVELWSLIALGLAPLSAILYWAIASYALRLFHHGFVSLNMLLPMLMLPLAGYYTPFVLVVCWVKYHYREDEF